VNTYQRGGDLQSRNPPQLLDRSFEQTRKYAEAVREVGKQENIPVLDVWSALYDAAGRDERALEQFLWDGLHLNSAGYEVRSLFSGRRLPLSDSRDLFCLQIMYEGLIDTIKDKYPKLHYDKLQPVFSA
jgi:hypothetical protein